MTELAFLGTGVMGLPMVRNLDEAGFAVHAYNRTPQRAAALQDEGIAVFGDPAEAAEGCSVMVTMLSQGDAVLEVAQAALQATAVSFSLARKDAQLARAVANKAGIELPALEGALARMLEAERRGHGDEDMAATYHVSEPGD